MDNKLLREKTNIFEFILASCAVTAMLFFTNLVTINIWKYSLDGLLGWALLVAFAGMSSYRTAMPGLLVALIWGLMGGDSLHIAVNILTVFFGMYAYNMFSHLRPQSPLNVYEGALAGSVFHTALTYSVQVHPCKNFLIFLLLELLIGLGTFKAGVNTFRQLGFINHEDPLLIAKIEKDWIEEAYSKINKWFKTNFHRPQKPGKQDKQ
jgi:hypothetical protein